MKAKKKLVKGTKVGSSRRYTPLYSDEIMENEISHGVRYSIVQVMPHAIKIQMRFRGYCVPIEISHSSGVWNVTTEAYARQRTTKKL